MAPYLVKEIQGQDLHAGRRPPSPTGWAAAISADVAPAAHRPDGRTTRTRYAGNGKITGVQIAAKTGTAEHGDDPKNLAPHVWYVAFAPAERPAGRGGGARRERRRPNNLAATGGLVAAPIGRAVIAAALGKASR